MGGYNHNPVIPRVGLQADLAGAAAITNELLWTSDTFRLYVEQGGAKKLAGEADFIKLSGGAFTGVVTFLNTGLKILDTDASHVLVIVPGSNLTAERNLTILTGDASRTISLAGDFTIGGAVTFSGAFATTLTVIGATNVTFPTSGTLMANPMTTQGDVIIGGASGAPARLAVGTARQVLAVNSGATAPEWVASPQSLMTEQGDILYASAANTPASLPHGTAGQVLQSGGHGAYPSWVAAPVGAKAWVNFKGSGTVEVNGSYNVTSITDNGTGDWTVNFTNALADANYAVATCVQVVEDGGAGGCGQYTEVSRATGAMTTTALKVRNFAMANVAVLCDSDKVFVAVFD